MNSLLEVCGDATDTDIRSAQRGIRDDDQSVGQAKVRLHGSGCQISALPDPARTGHWIPVIIHKDKSVEQLSARTGSEDDAMLVAMDVLDHRA